MVHGTSNHELFENLRLELRRGSLVLACLAALRQERYGYTLRKTLEEQGMAIDEGTLYPLLRRLESQGLLLSEWRREAQQKVLPSLRGRQATFETTPRGVAEHQCFSEWNAVTK